MVAMYVGLALLVTGLTTLVASDDLLSGALVHSMESIVLTNLMPIRSFCVWSRVRVG